jgi:tetratricopeptide (TPR) repeat protein
LIRISTLIFFFSFALAALAEKVPGTDLEEKLFELNLTEKKNSFRNFESLNREVANLNKYIGSYPPRFSGEDEREYIYQLWLELASDAEAYAKSLNRDEKSIYILGELYRQGHNMDVRGSAERALSSLSECLNKYPNSVACHLSASYFYLSIGQAYLDSAEKSLSFLRSHYSPKLNTEVEAGYAFLYLYRQDVPSAKSQLGKYITTFPNSSRTPFFKKILSELGDTIEYREN